MDKFFLEKISQLAKLRLSEPDRDQMCNDLNEIVGWIAQLDELDTSKIPPLETMAVTHQNVLREDVDYTTLTHAAALKNAPDKDTNYFRVPSSKN